MSRLCPAVHNPNQSEAAQPAAKRQRAAQSKPKSSDEVRARQLGLLGRASRALALLLHACLHSRACFSRVLQADQPSRPETPAPDAEQPPKRPTRTRPSGPSTRGPEAARDIHVLVGEVGYEILSNKEAMAKALRTFRWRRQKSQKTNRVIVQADQVRRVLHRGRPHSLSHRSCRPE